jgi:hypothetical protein
MTDSSDPCQLAQAEFVAMKKAHDDYVEFIERGRRILNYLDKGLLNEKRQRNHKAAWEEVGNIRQLHPAKRGARSAVKV